MEGTAESSVDTASDLETTGITPESVQDDSETETGTENYSTDSDNQDPDGDDQPESFSREDYEKALRDQEARLKESFRQREENARREAEDKARKETFDQKSSAAQRLRQQTAANSLWGLLNEAHKRGEEGDKLEWDAQKYGQLVAALDHMSFQELYEQFSEQGEVFLSQRYPDFAIPRESQVRLERAMKAYDRAGMFDARMEIFEAAITATLSPKLRKQVEEELAKNATEAKKETAMKNADANSKSPSRPSNGLTGGSGKVLPSDLKKLTAEQAYELERSGELDKLLTAAGKK